MSKTYVVKTTCYHLDRLWVEGEKLTVAEEDAASLPEHFEIFDPVKDAQDGQVNLADVAKAAAKVRTKAKTKPVPDAPQTLKELGEL